MKIPLIVVKRIYFDEFASGQKTIEYRRYGRVFTERTFYPGRRVRIKYQYNNGAPELAAMVRLFECRLARDGPDLSAVYPGLKPDDEIALIHLQIIERQGTWS
jgi:hypothetical protein